MSNDSILDLLFANTSTYGLLLLGLDGNILRVNAGMTALFGYTEQDLMHRNFSLLFTSPDRKNNRPERELSVAINTGMVDDTNWLLTKSKKKIWVHAQTTALKNPDGTVVALLKLITDHSEQKRLTDDLSDSKDFLDSILETIHEGLLVLSGTIEIMMANSFFYEMFKVSPSDTLGRSLYTLGNGQWDIPALRQLLEDVLPKNNPFENFEVEHNFPFIGKRTMVLNARQIYLRGEPRERILLAIEDITERKKLQNRKDDFISMASHELKTPVTSIKAYNQLLQNLLQKEGLQQANSYLKKMEVQINKLNKLIVDLLDVSRIQAGKLEFVTDEFPFDDLVAETIEDLQPAFPSHTIELAGTAPSLVTADRDRIGQVITNFITNAIKYSPNADRIHLAVSDDDTEVQLQVTDYGVGIKEQHLAHIFERFYRVDDTNGQKYPGLGIGLYVANQIIERHGGTIQVSSIPGKGSVFTFRLPKRARTA